MFKEVPRLSDSIILATIVILVLCGFIILSLIFFYFKLKKQLEHETFLKAQFQQTLLQTQLEIQEQTFKNISQEIHDNIGQVLSLARLHVNTMIPGDAKDVAEKIQDSDQLLGKAIQDLRDLSKSLNTAFITDVGLLHAIEYELDLVRKVTSYDTALHIEGNMCPLPPQQELILFRIFQEVLNNIIKHAKASEIKVCLCYASGHFRLQIKDNGQGFDATLALRADRAGMGFRNMQNRSQLIGAEITVESAAAQGTTVTVTLQSNLKT